MIIISGDSWGAGEWNTINGNYGVTHKGTEHFLFENGYKVLNLSQGDSSNHAAIERLKASITSETMCVVFFVSDPLRDLRPYSKNNLFKDIKSYDDLISLSLHLIDISYSRLDAIGAKVLMVGGVNKINLPLMEKYQNLIPLIPSITEMLIPGFVHPKTCFDKWIYEILRHKNKLTLYDIEMFLSDDDTWKSLRDVCPQYFIPDGHHANRHGHEKIAHKILAYIKNNMQALDTCCS